jgi:peroxiredoxin
MPDWSKLPVPKDDGAARHLTGGRLISLGLVATDGSLVDFASLPGKSVVFIYPRIGRPDVPNPDGWDMIPGARGCNSQACAFRDLFAELKSLGVRHLFGLSTQETSWQREDADRLHLPFPILSDESLQLSRAMRFPLFEANGMILLRRMTLVLQDGVIERVFYPVFPPDQNAAEVAAYLRTRVGSSTSASS